MTYTATVTQKGQVTIPLEVRKYLGIKPREKVTFARVKDQITINPAKDFLLFRGSIKSSQKYTDEEADKRILSYMGKSYGK